MSKRFLILVTSILTFSLFCSVISSPCYAEEWAGAEIGDLVFRGGVDFCLGPVCTDEFGHVGIYTGMARNGMKFVLQANLNEEGGVGYVNWNTFLKGNAYWGARKTAITLTRQQRKRLIQIGDAQQSSAYPSLKEFCEREATKRPKTATRNGQFRCDGFVWYCYETLDKEFYSTRRTDYFISGSDIWNGCSRNWTGFYEMSPRHIKDSLQIAKGYPPQVTFISPGSNAVVSGKSVIIRVFADDGEEGSGIRDAEFYLGASKNIGVKEYKVDRSGYYSYTWDSTSVSDGEYTIKVVVTDQAGNPASVYRNIRVQNGNNAPKGKIHIAASNYPRPTVEIRKPDGTVVRGWQGFTTPFDYEVTAGNYVVEYGFDPTSDGDNYNRPVKREISVGPGQTGDASVNYDNYRKNAPARGRIHIAASNYSMPTVEIRKPDGTVVRNWQNFTAPFNHEVDVGDYVVVYGFDPNSDGDNYNRPLQKEIRVGAGQTVDASINYADYSKVNPSRGKIRIAAADYPFYPRPTVEVRRPNGTVVRGWQGFTTPFDYEVDAGSYIVEYGFDPNTDGDAYNRPLRRDVYVGAGQIVDASVNYASYLKTNTKGSLRIFAEEWTNDYLVRKFRAAVKVTNSRGETVRDWFDVSTEGSLLENLDPDNYTIEFGTTKDESGVPMRIDPWWNIPSPQTLPVPAGQTTNAWGQYHRKDRWAQLLDWSPKSEIVLTEGEVKTVWVKFINRGAKTWSSRVNLGLRHDMASRLQVPGDWLSENRPSGIDGGVNVGPEEIAIFTFQVRGPCLDTAPSSWVERMRVVDDSGVLGWLDNEGGEVTWNVRINRATGAPSTPSGTASTASTLSSSRTVRFTWNDPGGPGCPNGVRSYRLVVDQVGGGNVFDNNNNRTTSTTLDVTLPADAEYVWYVQTVDARGISTPSTPLHLFVDATSPDAPTGFTVKMEHFNTSLSWSVPPDSGFAEVIGFNVYRRRTGTGGYEKQTPVPITSTTYEESVANLVMYDYAVTAIDSFGRESAKVEVTGQVAGKRGDLNNDGDIDITDVLVCINVIRNPDYFSPAQKAMSDFNRDGAINDADVKALRMAILGQ